MDCARACRRYVHERRVRDDVGRGLLNGTQTLVIDLTFARTTPSRWMCLRARLPSTNVACSDVNETC